MTDKRHVYSSYRFGIEIESLTEATFSECTGLQVEFEIFEWEEGGLNEYRHRLPGRAKYTNLVLKRGIASEKLWQWCDKVLHGNVERCDLSIMLYGYDQLPEMRWNITGAFPVKWVGPSFKSGATDAAMETLELAHHGFSRVK